jgi:hypothetical protein
VCKEQVRSLSLSHSLFFPCPGLDFPIKLHFVTFIGIDFSSIPGHKKRASPIAPALTLTLFSVPRTGLEPARPCEHQPLKLACLPISPPGPLNFKSLCEFIKKSVNISKNSHSHSVFCAQNRTSRRYSTIVSFVGIYFSSSFNLPDFNPYSHSQSHSVFRAQNRTSRRYSTIVSFVGINFSSS